MMAKLSDIRTHISFSIRNISDRFIVLAAGLATFILAAGFVAGGLIRPDNSYDGLAYAALAKQMRGEEDHKATYEALRNAVGEDRYKAYVSGPYREAMATDPAYFQANMPFYATKVGYVATVSVVGGLLGDDLFAMSIVSVVSVALAMGLSFWLALKLLPLRTLFVVPVAWLCGLGLKIATIHTPDAMAVMLQIAFTLVWLGAPDSKFRSPLLCCLAAAWVATRPNAIILLLFLMVADHLFSRRNRIDDLQRLVVGVIAVATYLIIAQVTSNLGHVVLFNFVFVDKPDGMLFPNSNIPIVDYLKAVVYGLFEAATTYPEFLLALLALAYLTLCDWKAIRPTDVPDGRQAALVAAMLLSLVAHFALYPAAWERFFVGYYVLVAILLVASSAPRRGRQP
jgi:hypothetical protein